jgi:de-etiolated-1
LIVYRFNWFSYCNKGENSDTVEEVPIKGRKFESYFSLLYSLNLATANEMISKDVFLITDCNCYGIFATATSQLPDPPARSSAVPEIPSIEKITFYLIRCSQ